jgi:hypothetical protein
MHQEKPRIGQVERSAQGRPAEFVDVAGNHLYVAQLQRRQDRPGPPDGRLAEVNANHPPGRAHHPRHDGKPANRTAATVDGMPALLHTDPAKGSTSHLLADLGDAQPPKILVAAIEDVTPDPLRDHVSHDRPLAVASP